MCDVPFVRTEGGKAVGAERARARCSARSALRAPRSAAR